MKTTLSEKTFVSVLYVFLFILVIITLYPLLHVLLASFSEPSAIIAHKGLLWKPLGFSMEAYRLVFSDPSIYIGYRNTLFIVIVGVALNLLLTALGAYVLSRKQVYWNNMFMFIITFTMFFSGGLVPLYLVVKGVGLTNTLWSTIFPFAVSTFNLIIMRTSFAAVPEDLEESAKMDGANHFIILFRIIVPLCLPVIAVMGLYYAVEKWNGWFYASIFIQNHDLFPLQIFLRKVLILSSTDSMTGGSAAGEQFQIGATIKYATIMVATLPILFVYPFIQRFFVKGVMIGAIKG
ncbi:carbohydrate ABC transporter permease [Paenibacillus radicis (ex Gao et al. 2016)]|uniref:ABC transporter permease n=1 Tax=Paenibacillus radicis (ex Gao et al. 2016) TaxID=1737354 RepID=A0A917H2Z5_9BACL|nr:carbohydrate ABC transporter permease [Paenibacillus radicis (ex Gao et al. 2016)]GGG65156.1 ABC transporter permease [Paenibacillus radicis (ex Gao et al. 2016)]